MLWPLWVYFAGVLAVVAGMIGISFVLGQRHRERATDLPYESGVASTGSARVRLTSNFFLVAILFVIFDLESVFILAWALSVRELGWAGYLEICLFIGVLVATLAYLWREGALDVQPGAARSRKEI